MFAEFIWMLKRAICEFTEHPWDTRGICYRCGLIRSQVQVKK